MLKGIWNKIKSFFSNLKRKVLMVLGIGAVAVASANVPVVPVDMEWVISYETVAFDTRDGDLEMNQYAVKGDGEWLIRVEPKSKSNHVETDNPQDIVGKKEVAIRAMKGSDNPRCDGCAYYSEFRKRNGDIVRVPFEGDYNDLRVVKDAPQPKGQERVSILSAADASAAIAHDNSSAGTEACASSISWSHTVNSATNGVVSVYAVLADSPGSGVWSTSASTFNGTAMTRVTHLDIDAGANDVNSAHYILATAGEGTGAKTIVIDNADTEEMDGGAETYTGVDQTTPYDGEQANGADSNADCTTSITTATNDLITGFCSYENTSTLTGSGSQTDRQVDLTWQGDHQVTTSELTGNGSVTYEFDDDDTGTNAHVIHAVNLNVASAEAARRIIIPRD